MPEDDTSKAETPVPGNAPQFVPDHGKDTEIAQLKAQLAEAQAQNTTLQTQVSALEGQVDEKKQQELEARLTALEAENATLKTENTKLSDTQTRAALLADLAGKVRDPEAVVALLSDDLKTKEGKPDVEAIIAKYPYQAPDGVKTATAPDGGGSVQTPAVTTLDKAVESKDPAAINAAFDAELKGANQ